MSSRVTLGGRGNDARSTVSGMTDMSTFSTIGETKIDEQTYNADPRFSTTFDLPDTEEFITYTTEAGCDFKIIQQATVEKCVQTIMSKDFNDGYFNECFVLAYKLVTSPDRLIELLDILFNPAVPEGMQWDEFAKNYIMPLRLKIMNFVRIWMRNARSDFEGNDEMIDKLQQLVDRFAQFNPTFGKNLQKLLQSIIAHSNTSVSVSDMDARPPIKIAKQNPKYINALQFHPNEFAKQITVMQNDLFRKIPYTEFLGNGWTKKNKDELTPHMMALVRTSQQLFAYVQTTILCENRVEYRALLIHYFLTVAQKMKDLGNFEGMKAVYGALQSTPIYRLRDSWDSITEEDKQIDQAMTELCDQQKNFARLREVMKIAVAPCIPYLGSTMSDLVFTEDGNKTGKNDLVNFFKVRQIGNLIKEIIVKQAVDYPFGKYEEFLTYYKNAPKMESEEELYELSMNLEKKRGPADKELQKKIAKLEKEGHARIKKYHKFLSAK